jgi:transcriptional regulator with XRE-family HTH domain
MDYDFGNRLQQLLNKNNISQRQLAKKVGITEAAVSRYINNLQKPRPDILAEIATTLDTTTDYLLGKEEKSLYDPETIEKYNHLIENEKVKVLFDKIGDLDDSELNQFLDIVTIIKKEDKESKK